MSLSKIVTIGAYGFDEAGFFSRLAEARVDTFCDIRLRRGVRGSLYTFANSQRLQERLATLGIRYVHLPELAPTLDMITMQGQADKADKILRRQRTRLSQAFIDAYRDQCLKSFSLDRFLAAVGDAAILALFCVETEPQACHRSLLATQLNQELGVDIEHLRP